MIYVGTGTGLFVLIIASIGIIFIVIKKRSGSTRKPVNNTKNSSNNSKNDDEYDDNYDNEYDEDQGDYYSETVRTRKNSDDYYTVNMKSISDDADYYTLKN